MKLIEGTSAISSEREVGSFSPQEARLFFRNRDRHFHDNHREQKQQPSPRYFNYRSPNRRSHNLENHNYIQRNRQSSSSRSNKSRFLHERFTCHLLRALGLLVALHLTCLCCAVHGQLQQPPVHSWPAAHEQHPLPAQAFNSVPPNGPQQQQVVVVQAPTSSEIGKLGPPVALQQVQYYHGPGVDLVALNRRRFEMEHDHESESSESDLRRGELIEHRLAAFPDRLLESLPPDIHKQLMDSLATEATFLTGETSAAGALLQDVAHGVAEDPDGASIERLTKSCLTVHASSARPDVLNVTFFLYTRSNLQQPFIMLPQVSRQELIKSSPLDPRKPIKWITHGFHTNVDKSEWMLEAKDKILAFEDANVILTDWRRGASPALAFYPKAAANAHVVAKMIVKILRRLRGDVDYSRVHLIGHSLGAHIMGFVGSAFTEEYLHQQQYLLMLRDAQPEPAGWPFWRDAHPSPRPAPLGPGEPLIGRVTACDPALPCFGPSSGAVGGAPGHGARDAAAHVGAGRQQQAAPVAGRTESPQLHPQPQPTDDWTPSMWTHLRPDSAIVVEVIHSNPGVMGYAEPLGDYDFYPNGLDRQPGCGAGSSVQSEAGSSSGPVVSVKQPSYGTHYLVPRTKRQFGWMGSLVSSVTSQFQGASSRASGEQSRFTSTIDRFIRPIRDFFTGYTCSHHRAVDYMVESLYYERVPQDRKLDRDFVCQMVGYRCPDYTSFKRGFCFRCTEELDCRAFTMTGNGHNSAKLQDQQQLPFVKGLMASRRLPVPGPRSMQLAPMNDTMEKFRLGLLQPVDLANQTIETNGAESKVSSATGSLSSSRLAKRVLPTFNHRSQSYQPPPRNQYYFDTRPASLFCVHHYHLFVKYRWFRVRESVSIDGLKLVGTLGNITQTGKSGTTFNRFTHQTYTILLTEPVFLGQIESLLVYGDHLKPSLVEYIEVTYMSNLDPRIRALGSARLCRSQAPHNDGQKAPVPISATETKLLSSYTFVRCSGAMV